MPVAVGQDYFVFIFVPVESPNVIFQPETSCPSSCYVS